MRAIGHLLLWVGFLAGAFWSVFRLENQESRWSTIPWGSYAASMTVGCIGIVILRRAKKADHADQVKTEAEYSVVRESLVKVSEVVNRLREEEDRHPARVVRCIDDECADPLADFADARQSLVKRFGLSTYAEVMTEFASAERSINRCWSAAADGYVDEVDASLRHAQAHLANASDLLTEAERSV